MKKHSLVIVIVALVQCLIPPGFADEKETLIYVGFRGLTGKGKGKEKGEGKGDSALFNRNSRDTYRTRE